ncbi:hypothetical protein CLNEO_19760 [Anaerotignum neopropionicum]|uniref:Uncharacterized protein n=1 Tax=Anaerotignum neopropionicum TaxID=36847 RepID=A0A136WDH5_9FIRM|nr:hypothetical protein [Anaerotignum neopropionicum]KXL52567.1 hypothetical protein CLNEO_19760 [Anaerotignum neopropionicum]
MKPISYEKRLAIRLRVNVGFMILSIVLFAIVLGNKNFTFLQPMYFGSLIGLFVASLCLFLRNKKLKKNPESMNKMKLLEADERNVLILRVSYTIFTYVSIGILYVSMLISGFFSQTIFYTLETLLCVNLVIIFFIRKLVEKMY